MRTNIDKLVDAQMVQVVDLLTQGQQGAAAERDEAFKKARGMIREIVLKLVSERQALLRRLKAAEIIAQVKRLIELETAALKLTKMIPFSTHLDERSQHEGLPPTGRTFPSRCAVE